MRLGFFFGCLIGAGIAAALARPETAEAPESTDAATAGEGNAEGLIEGAKRRAREALTAAREASDEKKAEMQRQFDDAKRGHTS